MNWFLRLLIGGNLKLLGKSPGALIFWGLLAAAIMAVGNVVLRSSHYRTYRSKSESVRSYLVMQFLLSAAIILGFSFALESYGSDKNKLAWSLEEKQNISHLVTSQEADIAAVRLANQGTAYSSISSEEMAEFARFERTALQEAQLIRNEVLEKALHDLPQHFGEYKRSLELQIQSVETGDTTQEGEAHRLHDAWVDWYISHRNEIRIPK